MRPETAVFYSARLPAGEGRIRLADEAPPEARWTSSWSITSSSPRLI